MPDAPTPWFGLAALIAIFAIPFLPRWLFEGPRKVRHWPQRHVCAGCGRGASSNAAGKAEAWISR